MSANGFMGKRVRFACRLERTETKTEQHTLRKWEPVEADETTGWIVGKRYLQNGEYHAGSSYMSGGEYGFAHEEYEPPYLAQTSRVPVYLVAPTPWQNAIPVPCDRVEFLEGVP